SQVEAAAAAAVADAAGRQSAAAAGDAELESVFKRSGLPVRVMKTSQNRNPELTLGAGEY
ncbi:hypothetical protein, partial [Bradyrhizobium altum]|uniref:hypothetical protein n=1 Tax=Bradyrhizobium altum TaxID=1571202 RepID=UPI001E3190E4